MIKRSEKIAIIEFWAAGIPIHIIMRRLRLTQGQVIGTVYRARLAGDPRAAPRRKGPKLTPEVVRSIRSAKGRQVDIGSRFGVDQSWVSRIRSGEVWAHA